jgi:hypothetical protein
MRGVKSNKQAIVWRIEGLQGITSEETRMTMMLNPANIDMSYAPLVNETRTLGGFVQEFWGEQLTTLSASGKTAMFYNDKGLTNLESRKSETYYNFIKLVNIYKNNGKDYDDERQSSSIKLNSNRIKSVGTIIMTYINKQYEGFFENFNIKELAEKPFNYEYDFSFKITRTIGDLVVQSGTFL